MYDEFMHDGFMDFFSMLTGDPQMVMRQAGRERIVWLNEFRDGRWDQERGEQK